MPDPLTKTEQEFLGQLCGFCERRAQNGVYMNFMRSVSRGDLPFLVVFAMGEQAEAIQKIILDAQMPRESAIQVVSSLDSIEANGW